MAIILPSCYELSDKEGKIRGAFNKTALKKNIWGDQKVTEYIMKEKISIGDSSNVCNT